MTSTSSTASSPRRSEKASSSEPEAAPVLQDAGKHSLLSSLDFDELLSRDAEDFDLLSQMTHM